ncbi:MAG: MarR family transcriptional regulator [Pseudomonadota bacterium]
MKQDKAPGCRQMPDVGLEDFRELLSRANSNFQFHLERELSPHNITAAQLVAVVGIVLGRVRTLTELSAYTGHDTGAMKRLLDRIESKGFIRRKRSEEDRRTVPLELSEQGRQLYPHIAAVSDKVNQRLFGNFSGAELAQFRLLLHKLIDSADR